MENGTTTDSSKTAAVDAGKSSAAAGPHLLNNRAFYLLIAFAGMLAAKLFFDLAFSSRRAPLPPAAPAAVQKAPLPAPVSAPPASDTAGDNLSALSAAVKDTDSDTPRGKNNASAEPPLLVLNGTFLSDGEEFAIINNQIVKAGDEIEGAAVKKISVNSVELEFSGRALRITSEEN